MTILGIHGDYYNPKKEVFESNASIIKNGTILVAISEERVSRQKLDGRFPWSAIGECLRVAQITIDEVDEVVFSSRGNFENALAYLKSTWSTYLDTGVLVRNKQKISSNSRGLLNSFFKRSKFSLPDSDREFSIRFIDHHYAHAAGAFYTSPFKNALVITLDGGGNGLDGGAYMGSGTRLKRFLEVPHFQSPGTMYSAITHDLGYKRHRHEGKITGLAAYGTPKAEEMGLGDFLKYDNKKHRFISKSIANHHKDLYTNSKFFYPLLKKYGKEDMSATVQHIFEQVILDFVEDARNVAKAKGNDIENICLAGGCFANVKLNQRILEMGFKNIFVFPAMGDGGLGAGAALYHHFQQPNNERNPSKVDDVYLGGEFSEEEMETALKNANLSYERLDNIEERLGELLAESKVIARFNGRMEYGPRALGNRSIIAAPFDSSINDWLNKKLNRTEFMPFAPSITEEFAADYFIGYKDQHKATDFMTITYEVANGMKEKIPAVVHVDNTARPQVVRKSTNESYYKIITAFNKISGVPVVLNTSFNIHEEPIVYTPEDAIRGFVQAKLDYLALGPFLVSIDS